MKKPLLVLTFLLVWLTTGLCSSAEQASPPAVSAAALLERIQHTYACGSFTARFEQVSTLKAMDITDTASGRAYFMEPGKMSWEYIEPEPQQIITDGKKLWIYKPQENQVMTGDVTALFKDGLGVSLLATMQNIQKQNTVSIDETRKKEGYYTLKLVPKEKALDLKAIYFYVSIARGLIEEVETSNIYDDITDIKFLDIHLCGSIEASRFTFNIPENADVLVLDPGE